MWARLKFLLMPIAGGGAALGSFGVSSPYESSLERRHLNLADPSSFFTYGTEWAAVNRLAFGALLAASIVFGLTLGRRSWTRIGISTVLAALIGAGINFLTDSTADRIGIAAAAKLGVGGTAVGGFAWCVLVPAGLCFTILIAMGPTLSRLKRAFVAWGMAGVGSFAAHLVGGVAGALVSAGQAGGSVSNLLGGSTGLPTLASGLPSWKCEAICVGVVLAAIMTAADSKVRAGTIRLVLGRNEYRDWPLDYASNRIGSAEGVEILIRGFPDVLPVHASIVRTASRFFIDGSAGPLLINGMPATQGEIVNNDQIQVGSATLVLLLPGTSRTPIRAVVPMAIPIPPPPSVPVPTQFGAVTLRAPDGGQFVLPPGRYLVGREVTSSIPLPHQASVSRAHAEVVVTPNSVQVVDLGSTNGTRINGAPVTQPARVQPGDVVEFGDARFLVSQETR